MTTHTQLVLRGSDLSAGTENTSGSASAFRDVLTWKNINLRNILGPLYDKYDTFNFSLSYVCSGPPTNALTNADVTSFGRGDVRNLILNIVVSGLPFIGSNYSQSSQHNTSSVFCGSFFYPAHNNLPNNLMMEGCAVTKEFQKSNVITIGKNQEQVNLTITLLRVSDWNPPDMDVNGTTPLPNTTFVFDITGCDLKKENASRLDMR